MNDGVNQNPDGSYTATVGGTTVYQGSDGQAAQNAFISAQPGGSSAPPAAGAGDPSAGTPAPTAGGPETYNAAYYQNAETAIQDSINNAYRQQYLQAIEIPGLNLKANDLALQAAQQRAQDLMGYAAQNGDLALKSFGEAASVGVDVANLLTKMQGPSNALAYDRAVTGLQSSGLSGSVAALTGGYRPPAFQALGPTSPMSFNSLNTDLGNGSGQPGFSVMDSLLGLGSQAGQQYTNATQGQLPFSLPQFDSNQNPLGAPTTPPANGPSTGSGPPSPIAPGSTSPSPTQPAPGQPTAPGAPTTPPPNGPLSTQPTQYNPNGGDGITTVPPSSPTFSTQPIQRVDNSGLLPGGGTPSGFTLPTGLSQSPGAGQFPGVPGGTPQSPLLPGYSQQASNYLAGLPDPGQVVAKDYFALPSYSQDLIKSGYAAKGYDPAQLEEMWQKMLPGSAAGPGFGLAS